MFNESKEILCMYIERKPVMIEIIEATKYIVLADFNDRSYTVEAADKGVALQEMVKMLKEDYIFQ
ncbi:hypothetical protein LF817_16310 [Halobacillus sp. A1]|uniref:hypothetical protein n=1 Tax=Halobacillus sp. A1 TaxID=2880262 RepID=UPI0020A66904|nr:hypothetical protein [Halobacillus sp. A1]MCP3032890.1 hypothetical protein [Halobacillus sp. A1]